MSEPSVVIEAAVKAAVERAMRRVAPAVCLRIAELAVEELRREHPELVADVAPQRRGGTRTRR
jgi:histone H3/H4